MSDERYVVSAMVRGFDVLRCFDRERSSLSLGEVARMLGWRNSEPFRYLYTLVSIGYLRRDPVSKRYELTTKILDLGFSALATLQLPEIAQPYLEELRTLTNASTHLGILDDDRVLYIARASSRAIDGSTIGVGSHLPVHATSIGKVLLAMNPEGATSAWLAARALPKFTENTIADKTALLAALRTVRDRGYALADQEFSAGVRSVAAPVCARDGTVIAAINASAPIMIFSDRYLEDVVVPSVMRVAAELSLACAPRFSSRSTEHLPAHPS